MMDKNSISPDSKVLRREFFSKLISKNFTRIEQEIIYYYYYDNLTMEEISVKLNMSESRVSQLHSNILPRLKSKIKRNPGFFSEDIESYNDEDPLF